MAATFASFDATAMADARKALAGFADRHAMTLTGGLAELAEKLLRTGLEAGGLAIVPVAPDLSPEQAGKILGVSRPLVVQRMDDGRLPFHYVGSHRRCSLQDVLKLKDAEGPVNKALAELYDEHAEFERTPGR